MPTRLSFATGDAERLAQAQAAGTQLVELCPQRSGTTRLGSASATAAASAEDDDSDWETASLNSQQDDGSCSDGELEQGSQRRGLAAAAADSAGSSASRLSYSSDEEDPTGLPRELRGITPLHLAVANSDTACIQVRRGGGRTTAVVSGMRDGLRGDVPPPAQLLNPARTLPLATDTCAMDTSGSAASHSRRLLVPAGCAGRWFVLVFKTGCMPP